MIVTDVSEIGKWSRTEIELVCDKCKVHKKIEYRLYTSYGYSNGEYLCRSCKLKKNNLEKWGVENVFQLNEIKEKSKKTNLEKRGVEFISQSEEVKNKIKTSLSKLDKEEVNEKRKRTTLLKWGVENVSQNLEIKSRKSESNLIKFGETNNKKSESFRKDNFKIANDKDYISYIKSGISLFKCDNGIDHDFEIEIDVYSKRIKYNSIKCTICNPPNSHQSGKEIKLLNFIKLVYNGEVIENWRDGRQEIDIYLPEISIGFEFNGIYWQSESYKHKNFHLEKSKFFSSKGIHLIHIWEDDWDRKEDIIKSQIKNLLNQCKKIAARKCEVVLLNDTSQVRDFLDQNHLQGFVNSKIKLGLLFEGDLVSVMTFDQFEGRKKMSEGEWNLNRFCNTLDTTVIGGASKLLNFFIKEFNPLRIISYSDSDWSRGELYSKLKFKRLYETPPDYKYLVGPIRVHKSNFKKSKTGISENELTNPKVWDCGKIKWQLIIG